MELTFPAPNRPVSINERLHWAVLRRRLAPWRTSLRWAYLAAGSPALGPSVVTVEVPFARAGRRDPHNYVAPLVKALVDELVACGAWPDDTPEWVSVAEPVLVVGKDAQVVVRIEPRDDAPEVVPVEIAVRELAALLGIPPEQVTVHATYFPKSA